MAAERDLKELVEDVESFSSVQPEVVGGEVVWDLREGEGRAGDRNWGTREGRLRDLLLQERSLIWNRSSLEAEIFVAPQENPAFILYYLFRLQVIRKFFPHITKD
jgi:hypothetical protein